MKKKFVFISGLHRSGTSVLSKVLANQSDVSGFHDTGVPRDEGQHLQTVFQPASYYGGAGKFGFNSDAALNENSEILTERNKAKLRSEWSMLWNAQKSVFIEKSPPNIIRTRFLQEVFPNSYFITIVRHPIAVSYATQKWSKTSISSLIEHWLTCHDIYINDRKYLNNEIWFTYEHLVNKPKLIINHIAKFLDTDIDYQGEFSNENHQYFSRWDCSKLYFMHQFQKQKIISKFEERINSFGYSLIDVNTYSENIFSNNRNFNRITVNDSTKSSLL